MMLKLLEFELMIWINYNYYRYLLINTFESISYNSFFLYLIT
jgi:hypothetical protein